MGMMRIMSMSHQYVLLFRVLFGYSFLCLGSCMRLRETVILLEMWLRETETESLLLTDAR